MIRRALAALAVSLALFLPSLTVAAPNATGPKSGGGGGGGGGVGTSNLTDLADVDTTGAVNTNVLCLSAGVWVDCPAGSPAAHATTHQPGGADVITEIEYIVASPASNADYGGSDPGNLDEAVNYLAPRTRFALASNDYDAIADLNTQTVWRRTKPNGPFTVTQFSGNPCRVLQESVNYALTVTTPVDTTYNVGWFGEATADFTDFYDQGNYRGCVFIIPAASVPGTGGTGGYSVNSANRDGWPSVATTVVASGMNARTATGGGTTTLDDSDGSSLASLAGSYVNLTGGTGAGQTRKITSSTTTQLTVDSNFSPVPDATTVYRVFSLPALTGGSVAIHITEDMNLIIDQTGQIEPIVYMQRGNGYNCGYAGVSSNTYECGIAQVDFSGVSTVGWTNDVASGSWLAGQMPEASNSTIVTPNRAAITYYDNGYYRSRDDTRRTITCNNSGVSDDNLAYYTSQTWGLQRSAKGSIGNCGLGVKVSGNNATSWASQYISAVHYGISLGEVPNGGDDVPASACLSTYCTPVYVGGVTGLGLNDWIMESCDYGCLIHVDGGAEFSSVHGEAGTVLNHQWIIGAVRCDSGNATTVGRYVGETADCGVGGTGVAHATSPVTHLVFTGQGFSPSVTSTQFAAVMIGSGASQNNGIVSFGPEFEFNSQIIPANDAGCASGGSPYFYCTGAGTSSTMSIIGPRFPKTASSPTVRVQLMNSGHIASGGGAGNDILWPYSYYKFTETHVAEFSCDACDFNATDALGVDGGFAPDGESNAGSFVGTILHGYHFSANLTYALTYFTKMYCTPGPWGDGAEANESYTLRPFLYNGTTAVPIGSGLTFTEPGDTVGVPKAVQINTNSDHFDFASGTPKSFRGVWNLGVYVTTETDATDNNLSSVRCAVEYAPMGNE